VKQILAKLNIPVIDIDDALHRTQDPREFYAIPRGWSHFNAAGYRLAGQQIIARLNEDLPGLRDKSASTTP
jgi:hypothetical protein